MRVLLTNNALADRAGTELYIRDVAAGLLARGHTPIAYSTELGQVAEELRRASIPVIDQLDRLALPPDIIHGQHHLETVTALLRFPGVPVISFCHGWMPWQEAPPLMTRIRRYVAVDHLCRDRLTLEHGIPPERVQVLFNFVDLDRFQPRALLPGRPARALILNNHATEQTHLPAVREACARLGIALDVIGRGAGNATTVPEQKLQEYDVVFATGRSALEALAVGTSVVLCHIIGVGPMVTLAEFDRLRALNFGFRTLQMPLSAETIAHELRRYDADDAAAVSRRIRATASRDAAVDAIIDLYQDVIHEHAAADAIDLCVEEAEVAGYLRWLTPLVKERDALHSHRARLQAELEIARAAHNRSVLEQDDLFCRSQQLEAQCAHLEAQRLQMEAQRAAYADELAVLTGSRIWRLRNHLLRSRLLARGYHTLSSVIRRANH